MNWAEAHPKSPLTNETALEVVELYKAGYSLKEVAKKTYITHRTVARILKFYRVSIRPKGGGYTQHFITPHEDIYQTIYLYRDCGLKMDEVAEKLGMSYSGVHKRLTNSGVTKRKRGDYSGNSVR